MSKQPKINELACPFCMEPVNINAQRCPHCQSNYTRDQVTERQAQNKKENKKTTIGCLVLVAFALVGLATCSGGDEGDGEDSGPSIAAAAVTLKEDADVFVKTVQDSTRRCDYAFQETGAAMEKGDVIEAYTRAKDADSACLAVKVGDVNIPDSFDEAQRKTAEETLESCNSAYVNKWSMARQVKEILDGGNSVAAQAEFIEDGKTGQALNLLCAVGLVQIDALGEPADEGATKDEAEKVAKP